MASSFKGLGAFAIGGLRVEMRVAIYRRTLTFRPGSRDSRAWSTSALSCCVVILAEIMSLVTRFLVSELSNRHCKYYIHREHRGLSSLLSDQANHRQNEPSTGGGPPVSHGTRRLACTVGEVEGVILWMIGGGPCIRRDIPRRRVVNSYYRIDRH